MRILTPAIKFFLILTLLTGGLYPLFITMIAKLILSEEAEGGIIYLNDQPIGAKLIGQKFQSERYFWGRPSAVNYEPMPSGGSNLGPTSQKLKELIAERKDIFSNSHIGSGMIPSELLLASASGIDPHLSPRAAHFQVSRIAKARNLESRQDEIRNLVNSMSHERILDFVGKPYINVLLLNLALDREFP